MPNLKFLCPHCQQSLDAPAEFVGEVVECPTCKGEITIPAAVEAPPAASEGGQANTCDSCGATLEAGAVLCLSCGYHKGLGKKIETELS